MGKRVFVIGASLAGIDALCQLVAALPANFPAPIFIVQHVSPYSPSVLPQILARAGHLPASHPKGGEVVRSGHIYVAPPDRHMLLRLGYISLSHGEVENRIAEGVFNVADWWQLEQMSAPSGLNCPDCRSALYEIKDPRLLRYRCRSGHAYSGDSLLRGLEDARERHLSSIFGALIEEATLAKRLRGQIAAGAGPRAAERLDDRTRMLEGEAEQVCGWLREMTAVVEPEP